MAKVTVKNTGSMDKIAKSGEMLVLLEPAADAILAAAQTDPNPDYVATLRKQIFRTGGRAGRVSWQVGAHPRFGARVEAKRGTMARAVGSAGL